jgi:tRNA modification GTPase
LPAATARVERLSALAEVGSHLTHPWRIVLAGRPNVGKSSLINALVGFERALVHATPGTTRDLVTAASAIDGWPVELIDTAGLRSTGDALEAAGIRLAEGQMAAADLVVLVFDASSRGDVDQQQLATRWPEALTVYNKCDRCAPSPSARARVCASR